MVAPRCAPRGSRREAACGQVAENLLEAGSFRRSERPLDLIQEREKRLLGRHRSARSTFGMVKSGGSAQPSAQPLGAAREDFRRLEARQTVPTSFDSKRDTWLALVIWIGAVLAVTAGISQFSSAASFPLRLLVLAFFLSTAGLMLWILYGTAYSITPDRLHARSGPFRFQIPLAEIDSVEPSRNPLSSPACSLDRLDIRFRQSRRGILVSPLDKAGFLQALVDACPHLTLRGDRLVRRGGA